MPTFGKRSKEQYRLAHPKLQAILDEAIKVTDFSIIQSHRDRTTHMIYLQECRTTVPYERTMHRFMPSKAVDLAPYPINWDDIGRFHFLGGVMFGIAQMKGIELRWGGQWRKFKDYPHFELR